MIRLTPLFPAILLCLYSLPALAATNSTAAALKLPPANEDSAAKKPASMLTSIQRDDLRVFKATTKRTSRPAEQIYLETCSYCHDHGIAPVITGRQLPLTQLTTVIRNGLNAMPAFRPTDISDSELKSVATWISNTKQSYRGNDQ